MIEASQLRSFICLLASVSLSSRSAKRIFKRRSYGQRLGAPAVPLAVTGCQLERFSFWKPVPSATICERCPWQMGRDDSRTKFIAVNYRLPFVARNGHRPMELVWANASAAKLDEFSQREVTERFGSIDESESQIASHKNKIQGVANGKAND